MASVLGSIHGGLISALIVAAPWLFACTEEWSMRLMNVTSAICGLLGVLSWWLTRGARPHVRKSEIAFPVFLLCVNLLLLLFCLVAFVNARAQFSMEAQAFTYREGVLRWLPTSYDSQRTWQFFVNCIGFFCAFWSVRAWISGARERASHILTRSNKRLEFLLWIFVGNGFLVALQGLLQRLSGSSKLLWFRTAFWSEPSANFGPFSYRGNAADFLNMVWPISFGFWYFLAEKRRRAVRGRRDGPELVLFPVFLVTLAASFATLSRGGVIVAALLIVALAVSFVTVKAARFWKLILPTSIMFAAILAVTLVGDELMVRFRQAFSDNLSGRTEIYANARRIAADFPVFGSGPGTFPSIYYMYRETPDQSWAAFAHDDWLETRVTFGWVGFSLVLIQFAVFFSWVFASRKRWISPVLSYCLLLSIFGCLVHAKVDFPFQTYGVAFTFVIVCALLSAAVVPEREREADTGSSQVGA